MPLKVGANLVFGFCMPREQLEWRERAKGFVGGVVSGLTKLAIGHPFDTVKIRLQCDPASYRGPMACLRSLVQNESIWALYKGCIPPAFGWMVTDSVLLGSLHTYRRMLMRWSPRHQRDGKLPVAYQGLAGVGAGWTNSFLTAPVELLKTKLQMQKETFSSYGKAHGAEFSSTWDCVRQVVRYTGVRGLWRALPATLLFRTSFGPMFASYEVFQRQLGAWASKHREDASWMYAWLLSPASVTFFAGGLAAEVFWFTAYPADVIKNRIMAVSLHEPRYASGTRGMWQAAVELWTPPNMRESECGVLGLPRRLRRIYTGYLTCALRAFPTNAGALLAFETAMYLMQHR